MKSIKQHIVNWLKEYAINANSKGFVIGISGGIDSAVTSTLCALTGLDVILLSMPIRQGKAEFERANNHITDLKNKFPNVKSIEVNLTSTFENLENVLPKSSVDHHLAMANTRSRMRMTTLYAIAQPHNCLVAGTGNKIEDFGVGFYTKYGDGGVDISPIADLTKTEVWELGRELGVINEIIIAKPTDGLFEDGRSDEDQMGATYPELEWAMGFSGDESMLNQREKEVIEIYRRLNRQNQHKMNPIPVCYIPNNIQQ
ncbi:MAG: NAD(+) synthase [Crocinitomicaceae bacterium]